MKKNRNSLGLILLLLLVFLLLAASGEFVYYTTFLHPTQLRVQATISDATRQAQMLSRREASATANALSTAAPFLNIYNGAVQSTPILRDPLRTNNNNWEEKDVVNVGGCAFTGEAYRVSA